jgi:hypothetical protein
MKILDFEEIKPGQKVKLVRFIGDVLFPEIVGNFLNVEMVKATNILLTSDEGAKYIFNKQEVELTEEVFERFTDYMLRYTADVPADEIDQHSAYDACCKCDPDVVFDEKNCWRNITHKKLNGN